LKIAIPAENGVDGPMSGHFGHTSSFIVFDYDESSKKSRNVEEVTNPPHVEGGCMQPVMILKNKGINAIILLGIGQRPFMGFGQVGIKMFRGIPGTVKENFDAFIKGQLPELTGSLCNH